MAKHSFTNNQTGSLNSLMNRIDCFQVLGLEVCADTMVGDEMVRGISGGQRKRVTTGKEFSC